MEALGLGLGVADLLGLVTASLECYNFWRDGLEIDDDWVDFRDEFWRRGGAWKYGRLAPEFFPPVETTIIASTARLFKPGPRSSSSPYLASYSRLGRLLDVIPGRPSQERINETSPASHLVCATGPWPRTSLQGTWKASSRSPTAEGFVDRFAG